MIIRCGWCSMDLGVKPGRGVTHGVCRYDELKLREKGGLLKPGERAELERMRKERTPRWKK